MYTILVASNETIVISKEEVDKFFKNEHNIHYKFTNDEKYMNDNYSYQKHVLQSMKISIGNYDYYENLNKIYNCFPLALYNPELQICLLYIPIDFHNYISILIKKDQKKVLFNGNGMHFGYKNINYKKYQKFLYCSYEYNHYSNKDGTLYLKISDYERVRDFSYITFELDKDQNLVLICRYQSDKDINYQLRLTFIKDNN